MNNILNYFILAGLVSSCTGFLDLLYSQLDANCQGTKSFICKNTKCVPKSKRCDGHADCLDSSDEEDCDLFFCKEPNYFKCKNEKCIFSSFVCDDENDCLDFSDEKDCKNVKLQLDHATNCTSEEWQCADRLCIPKEYVCNGESDCLDSSDEPMGCTLNLECDGFKCKNGHCVPNEWRCDGNNDCDDNSDELDCQSHISPKDCLMENKLFLCSNNLTCINMTNVCDKIPHCPDKSDEGPKCTSTDVCAMHKCPHECVQLPTGPKCLCPEGFQTIDDKTCKDINECETYGICDQKCKNKPGSYECYCDNKYELQPDKKTCKAVGGEAMMIYSLKTEIRGYFLESELMFPIAKNLKQVVSVYFDGHHVYWTDILSEHESIVRSLKDGSKRELLVTSGLGTPEDLAIDWITGNIYFTDSEIQHIAVCVNDGTKCTVLVNQDVNKPRGIALYPIEGDMYWSDWGKNPVIAKSKMDGTHVIPFVANNIKWPNGLAIDYPNERLYWADAKLSTLESIRLDGTDRRIVLDGIVKHPYAIAVFENTLIWSDWHSRSVQSCNKFTGEDHHTLIKEKKEYIYGLHIFHSALKPQSRNPCISAFCSDICLNTGPTSYTCACPQDKELAADKHTCKEIYKKQELIIGANNDCHDSFDELDCHFYFCKKPNYFKCKNQRCVSSKLVCDNKNDCGDYSDEANCSSLELTSVECIGFKCENGNCISNEFRCDGNNDCNDYSDEIDCDTEIQFFVNSHINTCASLNCWFECVQLETGPKCLCPEGFQTANDRECEDINECNIYGICDHKCKNTLGSYNCYCDSEYELQEDNTTCKVADGPPTMIYSTNFAIRKYSMEPEFNISYPIKYVKQAVGVLLHGNHIYWADSRHKSIVRSLKNGSQLELLITSGLDTPEDLALDWITNNIYFTDSRKQHIAVCVHDGTICSVLVNQGISEPRSIVLHPLDGDMYWSDIRGIYKKPEIGKAKMDGTLRTTFISDHIFSPNGLTIDYPNERLYWTDAKLLKLQSIRLDGNDRRIITENMAGYPYDIAIFENRLFWSDKSSNSIQSCNKFTGKDNTALILQNNSNIYSMDIFHSALKPKGSNPCASSPCSDICLNTGPESYSCGCPQNKILTSDNHNCIEIEKKRELIIGANNLLIRIEHKILGKHNVTSLPILVKSIGALAYNPVNDSLYIFDNLRQIIVSVDLKTYLQTSVVTKNLDNVNSLQYNAYDNRLYWCDSGRKTLEVLCLSTMTRTVLLHDLNGETPQSIAVVPQIGVIFIALEKESDKSVYIDRMHMDGSNRTHFIETGLIGPITLHYDVGTFRIFWADGGSANIGNIRTDGDNRHFKHLESIPVSITSVTSDLFWANYNSSRVYWANTDNLQSMNRRITLHISNIKILHLVSITSPIYWFPCLKRNGFCSDSCPTDNGAVNCSCPIGMRLQSDSLSCIKKRECTADQYYCEKSDKCIAQILRCDNHKDCMFAEDEEDCIYNNSSTTYCRNDQFKCLYGECISKRFMCDGINDCSGGEDEKNCHAMTCSSNQFRCQSGLCIPENWECDHEYDCPDLSDEHDNCIHKKCNSKQFTYGMNLQPNNLTCIKPRECTTEEFYCDKSDVCVAKSMRCNGRKDCSLGEDEEDCIYSKVCPKSYFQCGNGDCIRKSMVCDLHFDCEDKSDEAKCTDVKKSCESNQFRCSTGNCISKRFMCDGIKDCTDGEDEENCLLMPCTPNQFRCQSGLCIPKNWECDQEFDCPDLSDEHNDCTRKNCNSKQFTCDNNMCIDLKLKCNNIDDCGDSSDESSCVIKPAVECTPNEFQCKSDNSICLPQTALCNGTSECPRHEDEQGCSNCHIDEFTCDNKKCVPSLWICDGTDHCGDNSDEAFCSIDSKFENQNIPCDNGFSCKSGACIDSSLVCNGLENCSDGSDENGACNSSCKATSNPCDHTCRPTPTGPMCTCKDGYELTSDGHSCRDIEECSKEPPICSQKCAERTGGFICDCFDGYLIRSDKLSCKSIGDPMSIIYTVNNEIHQLSQSDNSHKIVYSEETTKISGLDVDILSNHIYFTIEESSTILRLNSQNGSRDFIRVPGRPQKLAVDWLTKNVYYVNAETAKKSIRACNFLKKRCAKIVNLDSQSQVSALAIDAVNKFMFYSLTSWLVYNKPRTVLYKMNLSGSRVTELVESGYITGITYDLNRKLLYYIDQHIGNINRINYDGNDKSVIFTNITKSNGLNLFEDHLYFSTNYGHLSKCKLFEHRTCETFRFFAHPIESFSIWQSTRQPEGHNFCERHACNDLCVPYDSGVQCICEGERGCGNENTFEKLMNNQYRYADISAIL